MLRNVVIEWSNHWHLYTLILTKKNIFCPLKIEKLTYFGQGRSSNGLRFKYKHLRKLRVCLVENREWEEIKRSESDFLLFKLGEKYDREEEGKERKRIECAKQ